MYNVDSLLRGIEESRANIKMLQTAIEKERKTIADYRIMISEVKTAQEQKEEAESNVTIEVIK